MAVEQFVDLLAGLSVEQRVVRERHREALGTASGLEGESMLPGAPPPRLTRAFWARGARLVTAATALKLLPLVVFVVVGSELRDLARPGSPKGWGARSGRSR